MIFHTGTEKLWLDQDGIIRLEALEGVAQKKEDVQKNLLICKEFCKKDKRPALVDLRKISSLALSIGPYFLEGRNIKVLKACAILVSSPFWMQLGRLFMCFKRPLIPIKIFNNEEAALHWLMRYLY